MFAFCGAGASLAGSFQPTKYYVVRLGFGASWAFVVMPFMGTYDSVLMDVVVAV
ncbi:hypothetical protein [Mycobacterium leprae]|uniref:hypothetical protein n=1 Tax=Mycobacterium leprae TaxID=1769 RepID=UPI000B155CF8|nr:hypothetical protein [Mycobacterium leprae]